MGAFCYDSNRSTHGWMCNNQTHLQTLDLKRGVSWSKWGSPNLLFSWSDMVARNQFDYLQWTRLQHGFEEFSNLIRWRFGQWDSRTYLKTNLRLALYFCSARFAMRLKPEFLSSLDKFVDDSQVLVISFIARCLICSLFFSVERFTLVGRDTTGTWPFGCWTERRRFCRIKVRRFMDDFWATRELILPCNAVPSAES